MKKQFKIEEKGSFKGMLFDETTNAMFHPAIFMGKRKRLTKKQREKCLADLGSGSKTEYESAKTLYEYQVKDPIFLDWLIECCEKEEIYLNSYLCWAFLGFQDDERVLPAIIKSVSKCPDEDLSNYPGLLGIFGGKEAKDVLKKRFYNLKDNPQAFAKCKDWNDLGFSLLYICEILLQFEHDNLEAAECIAKLAKHPNSFNKETALRTISKFLKAYSSFSYSKTKSVFVETLEAFSKTTDRRIFGILLPYLFRSKPQRTYQRFKKLYLKTQKENRYNQLAFDLIYSVENPLYWISKLTRELPKEDSEYFRDYLNWNLVRPISDEELISATREDFASESPSKRASAVDKLKQLKNKDAQKILEEALVDEPDEFIRTQFEKHLKKLKEAK